MRLNAVEQRQQTVLYTCLHEDQVFAFVAAKKARVTVQEWDGTKWAVIVQGDNEGWSIEKQNERSAALIGCSKSKAVRWPNALPARELYVGDLFKAQLAYAQTVLELPDEHIFVMSARYGLVPINETIASYDRTLADMSRREQEAWANLVLDSLQEAMPNVRMVHILAGKLYHEPLKRSFLAADIELLTVAPSGFGYGQQVAWYQGTVASKTNRQKGVGPNGNGNDVVG
jgi:hypothetical protein